MRIFDKLFGKKSKDSDTIKKSPKKLKKRKARLITKIPSAFSPKGEIISTGYANGTIKVFDIKQQSLLTTLSGDGKVELLDIASDGSKLASVHENDSKVLIVCSDGTICLWSGGSKATKVEKKSGYLMALSMDPTKLAVFEDTDKSIKIGDMKEFIKCKF